MGSVTQSKSLVLGHDRPAPRYTSYPPANHFIEFQDPERHANALGAIQPGTRISLYLHIPFCSQLCYYCGCFTAITKKNERIERYLAALKEEARIVSALLPDEISVAHVHFGGGSPTLLTTEQFDALMGCLRHEFTFARDAEIAIEADPRQLSEEKISSYAENGINRISFGVQDFDQRVLSTVNRAQDLHLTEQAVDWCRTSGITAINFDLMYGLPHQNVAGMRKTIASAVELEPSRIAFFGYAHVPWMKNHMKAMDMAAMPDASLRYDLFRAGSEGLANAGYHAVGIDHFVRTGDSMHRAWQTHTLRRNFQGYTTDAMPVLVGLGASAITKTPQGYVQNKADIAAYETAIGEKRLPPARGVDLQEADAVPDAIIESLMCYFEVDLNRFSSSPDTRFATARQRLQAIISDGLVAWENNHVRILQEPQLMARIVASAFDEYTIWSEMSADTDSQRHARAV